MRMGRTKIGITEPQICKCDIEISLRKPCDVLVGSPSPPPAPAPAPARGPALSNLESVLTRGAARRAVRTEPLFLSASPRTGAVSVVCVLQSPLALPSSCVRRFYRQFCRSILEANAAVKVNR